MKLLLLLLSILGSSLAVHAEKGQSIMFGNPDPIYQQHRKDSTARQHEEHCKQLRTRMDELKGKPQRRHAVAEQYRLECSPPEIASPPQK